MKYHLVKSNYMLRHTVPTWDGRNRVKDHFNCALLGRQLSGPTNQPAFQHTVGVHSKTRTT